MALTFVQPGDMLDLTAPANVAAGNPAVIGAITGVAQHSANTGQRVTIATRGVWRLTKAAVAISEGAQLYALHNGTVTTSNAGGAVAIGRAYRAAADTAATVEVYLG